MTKNTKFIYIVSDSDDLYDTKAYENKKEAVKYAYAIQKEITAMGTNYDTSDCSLREVEEFYQGAADGDEDCNCSLNGILLQRLSLILDKEK